MIRMYVQQRRPARMKENIVLRQHRSTGGSTGTRHTEEPRGGALLENCTDAVPATGNGSAWVLAAATNLGSVSLQPQWAMSGEWAEQIMGRTWSLSMSEYVIGT